MTKEDNDDGGNDARTILPMIFTPQLVPQWQVAGFRQHF